MVQPHLNSDPDNFFGLAVYQLGSFRNSFGVPMPTTGDYGWQQKKRHNFRNGLCGSMPLPRVPLNKV